MCGYALYGADNIVFGTDMPYDFEFGERNIRQNIDSVEAMPISDHEKKMIYEDNARKLLGL
jgi:predicted TIM-barrel fold metal-dependent hydrolase